MLRLSVPQPCHEKWEDMTPVEHGAYCQSCCKEVTDFSYMTDEEIAKHFMERKGTATCGRFYQSQLDRPLLYISPDVLQMHIPYWKKFLAVLFICFSGLLTSCESSKTPADAVMEWQAPDAAMLTEKSVPVPQEYITVAKPILPKYGEANLMVAGLVEYSEVKAPIFWDGFGNKEPGKYSHYFSVED